MVSIHIPFCRESSSILIPTIKSCLNLDYTNYEIILLANNTQTSNEWKIVERFCEKFPNIKFYHYHKLSGHKAAALNICRSFTNENAKYLLTVDADYIVDSQCLKYAVSAITEDNQALVQFPQAYRNTDNQTNALSKELRHFFSLYANNGNRCSAVLPTGTLSMISLDALDAVGGWKSETLTEDAELGTRFLAGGFKTVYVDKKAGEGIMPTNLDDLLKQRYRWAFGNFQTLLLLLELKMPWRKKFTAFIQLVAWFNFLIIPFSVLGGYVIFRLIFSYDIPSSILALAVVQIVLFLFYKYIIFGHLYLKGKDALYAFLTHIGLAQESSFAVFQALLQFKRDFICTGKIFKTSSVVNMPLIYVVVMLLSIILLFQGNEIVLGSLLSLSALVFFLGSLRLFNLFSIPENENQSVTT